MKKIVNRSSPQAQRLSAHFPLNENGGMAAYNTVGIVNGAVVGSSAKFINGAIDLTAGGSDAIDCGDNVGTRMTTSFTMNYWLKRPTAGTLAAIGKYDGGSNKSYELVLFTDNTFYLVTSSLGTNDLYHRCTTVYSKAGWCMITGVYDGSLSGNEKLKIYWDGILQTGTYHGVFPSTLYQNTAPFRIGRYDSVPTYSTCQFRDVRLYSKPLSQTEIRDIFSNTNKLYVD